MYFLHRLSNFYFTYSGARQTMGTYSSTNRTPFLVVQQRQSVAKYPKLIISGIIEYRCVVGTYKKRREIQTCLEIHSNLVTKHSSAATKEEIIAGNSKL